MFTYDEHSGAGNTGWPQLNDLGKLEEQNREYVSYMQHAEKQADFFLDHGMALLASPLATRLRNRWHRVTFGHCSCITRFPGNEMISSRRGSAAGLKVVAIRRAGSQQSIPFDIDEQGRAVFVASDLPSVGYAMFQLETAQAR